jgi:hypothetical protein
MNLGLSRFEGDVRTPVIGFSKLLGDIGEVLHHPALPLPTFSPFSFFFLPALEKRRGAINAHPAERLLSGSAEPCRFVLRMDVLGIHLRLGISIK